MAVPLKASKIVKKIKLIKTANYFLQAQNWLYKVHSRFDIVAIHDIAGKMHLEWFKNAFWPKHR